MHNPLRLKSIVFLPFLAAGCLFAQDADLVSPLVEQPAKAEELETPAGESAVVGTKAFDADTVNELFAEYQAENEKAATELAPHMNFDNLEVIELGAVRAQAYEVNNLDLLVERLDPQPRRRLQRLAELDPVAAADLRVTSRSEERFFAGENDYGADMNAGSTANIDFREVGKSLGNAISKAKAAMREKKATDDQQALPATN